MMRRRAIRGGRPGLVGTMARTAVIAGTATAVSRGVNNKLNDKAQTKAEAEAYEQQMAAQQQYEAQQAAAPPPAPAGGGDDLVSKLGELAQLHSSGVLTDAEFEAAKAKLIGS